MILSSAERVLVHLHGLIHTKEIGREATQAGIGEGAHILRSHVPRTLKALIEEGLVESQETRLPGRTRRATVYALTPPGVSQARDILGRIDATVAELDGRATTLGEARKVLDLTPLEVAAAVDERGKLTAVPPPSDTRSLLQRDEDLGFLKRWRAGGTPVAVVYGSRGIGKTALGRTFARTVPKSVWIDVATLTDLEAFAAEVGRSTRAEVTARDDPSAVAAAILGAFGEGIPLIVIDGYGEAHEGIVDALAAFVRFAARRPDAKLLVLAQETTPAYCRFYGKKEVDTGGVAERHLKGLNLEGCREMLGNPSIKDEDLRRIFLLTKGCPLYLLYIRDGDEYGLKQNSRFTKAEIRLLLYSGRASP
ncbi:MAG TPA: ATP-binding protein [Thermoplasmata archaeon]